MGKNKEFHIYQSDDKVYQFRGFKLLEMTSRRGDWSDHDRWINLTLYRWGDSALILVIEYDSNVTSPHEKEKPHVHVEEIKWWMDLAIILDRYDFMQHVNLDDSGGGHSALMAVVGKQYASICHRFRSTAMDFLEECNRNDSKPFRDLRFNMW